MFFIFHLRPDHSYWWLDAKEKTEEAKALEVLAVSKLEKGVFMFHSSYPSCQADSPTQCSADPLLYT